MNKKFAFTLSEVLVTMGIIGVISALTVPTLVNNYQRKALALQLRKTVSDIENAVDMLITEEGKTKFSATSYYNNLDGFITNRLKTIKTCTKDKTNECFANENYNTINGDAGSAFTCEGNSYVLANSAAICMYKKVGLYNGNPVVVVDTNGQAGPNIGGRDIFTFTILPNGEIYGTGNENECSRDPFGDGCFDLLVTENNWKMNY